MLIAAAILLLPSAFEKVGECRELLVPKQAGQEVVLADTTAVRCQRPKGSKPDSTWLVYDPRAKIVRARTALAAGQNIGRAFFPQKPAIRAGDRVALTAHLGHVIISREVVALQDAGPAQAFFVRDPDGQVFVMPPIEKVAQP